MGSFHPQTADLDFEDIELGKFGDRLKKGFRTVGHGLTKVTDATITKPSMMIGKMVGGKKGEAMGRKLGGFTSTVTKLGVGAGAAGAVLPLLASPTVLTTAATAAGTGLAAKHLLGKKRKPRARAKPRHKRKSSPHPKSTSRGSCKTDNALAAKMAAMLAAKLGTPLSEANRALKLAELQRQATYEHNRLMTDSEFREKVLKALAMGAAGGDAQCQRTVRVIMAR